MPVIRLSGFQGENRAVDPKLLSETVGVVSRNQKPAPGDLRPWLQPVTVATVPGGRQTIYRFGRDVASDSLFWLSWPSVVHAVRGFDALDTTERTYYTGDGAPKVTSNTMALASAPFPTAHRPLGLPAPTTAPVSVANAGTWTGPLETYFYLYTYVNDWGWESAPSPPGLMLTRPTDATVTVSGFVNPPAGNHGVNRIRLYRTQSGATATEFFFLLELALGTVTTQDDNRMLGEVLPTATWLPPPSDLSHMTALWNGMLAGISGGAVRFCEPFVPYAWPIAYDVLPPDSRPVALGVFGQSLLVLTTGRPLLVTGSSPDSMDQQLLEIPQACIAPRSVASMGSGVAWASEDGLCWFGSGNAKVLTAGLISRENWQAMNPASMIGSMAEGLYFGSYLDGAVRRGFVIDPLNPNGIYFMDTGYTALHFDDLQDQLYVLAGGDIQRWNEGAPMTYRFRSKEFRLPRPLNFAAAEVVASGYPVTVRVFADGVLRHTQAVANQNPFRLPSGFMGHVWQIEIEGVHNVQRVTLATSMAELADE